MNRKLSLLGFALLLVMAISQAVSAQEQLRLHIDPKPAGLELRLPAHPEPPIAGATFQSLKLEKSRDLIRWEPADDVKLSGNGGSSPALTIPSKDATAFFRVQGKLKLNAEPDTGADIFGYDAIFARELDRIGQISVEDFAQLYPWPQDYLPQISFDPTAAAFWEDFSKEVAQTNAIRPGVTDRRLFDFRLNADELALFRKNGFVVSERQATYSFAEMFYRIYTDDLPVFVSTDAILQAWHRSYMAMLNELEELVLAPVLNEMLNGMAARVIETYGQYGSGPLGESILDADYYLTVARTLLAGSNVVSSLRQTERVATTLAAIQAEEPKTFVLFDKTNIVDFSQFKVRGHYEESVILQRYFRAMMWLGRTDFRVVEDPVIKDVRQLGTAVVLHDLLLRSKQLESWHQIDRIIRNFVGWSDSMTFPQLGDLLKAAGIQSLNSITDEGVLVRLQDQVLSGRVGVQQIRGDYYQSPLSGAQMKLPRSITFLGQRFVPDSWAFSKTVFDSIIWDEDGIRTLEDKVQRRIPSALDFAFASLGNNQIVPELVERMTNKNGHPYRDGLPYQHNLSAARFTIDSQSNAAWESSIYMNWLQCLRELSAPTTDSKYPEAMRTRAWAMKNLNAQLASWTHLRHDTVLYAKQSYTGFILCFYPHGFVEPLPGFWYRMERMARLSAELLRSISITNSTRILVPVYDRVSPWGGPRQIINLESILQKQIGFLDRFGNVMATLRIISERELAQQPLTDQEISFLRSLVEAQDRPYEGFRRYSGWYPGLFYLNAFDGFSFENGGPHPSDKADQIVTDVHTNPADALSGDAGSILHQAVGTVHLLMIAIDNGSDRMVYAGPVLSHYEFEAAAAARPESDTPFVTGMTRWADSEWQRIVQDQKQPAHPFWTRSHLVPGKPQMPSTRATFW